MERIAARDEIQYAGNTGGKETVRDRGSQGQEADVLETVLIVDDAELNRDLLRVICDCKYNILEACDGEEAISIIREKGREISLVFLDLMMPKKDGLEVLAFLQYSGRKTNIPVIMITGEATVESDLKAYEYGADDIIYKPFDSRIVLRRAQNLIELYKQRNDIEAKLMEQTVELRRSQEKLQKNNEFLINALGSVVEFRSLESGAHIQRVSGFTKILLRGVKSNYPRYGLTDDQINVISRASALHDVGKIGIPDAILNKPGRFTAEEFETMKRHTLIGCDILERFKQEESEFYRYCYDICRWHHEKADGKGYPDGLTADQTPIWAQATAVADCFDALVSKRVYKDSYGMDEAFDMIRRGECGAFSGEIMRCFELVRGELFSEAGRSIPRAGTAGK